MDCSICCEKFNKSTHARIECKSCDDESIISCRKCCKKYLTDNSINPKCMICKVEWDYEFLNESFTKIFINKELKEIKENVLLEKEIAKLPETQEYAQTLKLRMGLEKQLSVIADEKVKLNVQIEILNKQQKDICNSIGTINASLYNGTIGTETTTHSCKCPVDSCKGFLDSKYNCGICENQICKKCMEIKEEDHECDEDKVETIKLLKKDTKPCPKCGQLIFKINGCDQMWCPPCHTPFSWRTGQIESGNVHNPEYYRWMRENNKTIGRDPQDQPYDPCGNVIPGGYQLFTLIRVHFPIKHPNNRGGGIDCDETVTVINMHRLVRHIEMLNTDYTNSVAQGERERRNLRAKYLLNEITQDHWKKQLQIMDKKHEKNSRFNNSWNLLNMVLIEYIGKIMEDNSKISIEKIVRESIEIRQFCNESFKKIGKMYNCVYPGVSNSWIQIENYKEHLKRAERRAGT